MVTTSDESPSSTLPSWPLQRYFYTDVVPHPASYQYRVSGRDIFGRQSDFGPWSEPPVKVEALRPPPPASITAKWLDPDDPNLTDHERSWMPDKLPGVLIRWKWLDSQDRQSPFVEKFHLVFEQGWLNHLLGTVKSDPVKTGKVFKVDVNFERTILEDELAGMTMAYQGIPYRILTNTKSKGTSQTVRLTCVIPNSGLPSGFCGETVSIPLDVNVRAIVKQVEVPFNEVKTITLLIKDLRAKPVAGFEGAILSVGGHSWPLFNVTANIGTNGVRLEAKMAADLGIKDIAFIRGLQSNSNDSSKDKTVFLQLSPPTSLFVNYRSLSNWPIKVNDPVPSEGTGFYEVFVRKVENGETPGRTTISARCHKILILEDLLPDSGIGYGQAAVASESLEVIGSVSSPVTFVRVSRVPPAPPVIPVPPEDIAPIYASRPDYYGHSSYGYSWLKTIGNRYIVYRALDETLFAVDRHVRSARTHNNIFDWDSFFNQFPETIRDDACTLFIDSPTEPDYNSLSNRLLQILASFPDVEEAFTRLHEDQIAGNDPEYVSGTQCIYKDSTLPAQGTNRYFYRVRTIDPLGNAGKMSLSSLPIYLRPGRPQTPVITRVIGGERKITLTWTSNQEPNVKEYRVYRTDVADNACDLRLMTQVAVVTANPNPSARSEEENWTDEPIRGLVNWWYRIVTVNHPNTFNPYYSDRSVSMPSSAVKAMAVDTMPPNSPVWLEVERLPGSAGVRLVWQTDEAGVASVVNRRLPAGVWRPVSDKLQPLMPPFNFEFIDITADSNTSYEYRIVVVDEAGNRNINTEIRSI